MFVISKCVADVLNVGKTVCFSNMAGDVMMFAVYKDNYLHFDVDFSRVKSVRLEYV